METTIYLMRHAESSWNKQKRFQGSSDIRLSINGRTQAEKLGKYFKEKEIESIYSSPLQRCLETARIAFKGKEINVEKNLIERNYGEWEGLTREQIMRKYEKQWHEFMLSGSLKGIKGGEPLNKVTKRSFNAVKEIASKNKGKNIAVISHGRTNKQILSKVIGFNYDKNHLLHQNNACINELILRNNTFVLKRLNYFQYLVRK